MAKELITYKEGDPHRIIDFGAYKGLTCLEACRKDKDSRKWQASMCNHSHNKQLVADLQEGMIMFLKEHWLAKRKGERK